MKSQLSNIKLRTILLGLLLMALSCSSAVWAQEQVKHILPNASAPEKQKTFATPQLAADALIKAAESYDVPALLEIFGPEGKDLVESAPATVKEGVSKDEAESIKKKFEEAGATIEIK